MRGEQPELHRPRIHSLDPWRAVLERRWREGCRNGARLWRDLRDAGFEGGMRVVAEWANRQRMAEPERQPGPAPASATQRSPRPAAYPARRMARMLTADLAGLAEPDRAYVERLLAPSPTLAAVRNLAQRFGAMVRTRSADALIPWLADAGRSEPGAAAKSKGRLPASSWSSGRATGVQSSTCSGCAWSVQHDNDLHRGCR